MGTGGRRFNTTRRAVRPGGGTLSADDLQALRGFLAALADRHVDPDVVFALRLAETGLAALERPSPAPTLTVVGPTQTGKSTVVNVLAGGEWVETSPLAAHTQQAAALAMNLGADGRRLPDVHALGLPVAPLAVDGDGPPCLIWDTPDFDSNAAGVYRQQVARVCALADLVVVVVSREKYADQSVWTVLETLAPLETPTLVCLNKTDDGPDTAVLVGAVERRLAERFGDAAGISVLELPSLDAGASAWHRDAEAFRSAVFDRLAPRQFDARRTGLERLIRANWAAWVEPLERELACQREWHELVAARTRAFLERYRSEYIDHSRHHDVARKAILGLLELLEIPALAGPISRTRRILTWPFRRLAGALGRPAEGERDKEVEVLEAAIDHYLLSLRAEASARRHPWWRELEAELSRCAPDLRQDFRQAVERYRRAFQPRIDDLSSELYRRLQQNPATLNALRATRVSADAGGILIAFKTGTLGLYDALFAPAVISLTSYLTESAVGQYLRSVIAGLKREQYEQVSAIVQDCVQQPLDGLRPDGAGLFGMSDDELARARRSLEALAP